MLSWYRDVLESGTFFCEKWLTDYVMSKPGGK